MPFFVLSLIQIVSFYLSFIDIIFIKHLVKSNLQFLQLTISDEFYVQERCSSFFLSLSLAHDTR